MTAWLPSITVRHVGVCIMQLKAICKATLPYIGLASLRVLSRSVCTAARFQSRNKRCCFGCTDAYDDLRHYAACPVLQAFAIRLFGELMPLAPPSQPWLCGLLPLQRRSATIRLLSAAFIDAFLSAHSQWRHGVTTSPLTAMEARLRQQSKRHLRIASAWVWLAQTRTDL